MHFQNSSVDKNVEVGMGTIRKKVKCRNGSMLLTKLIDKLIVSKRLIDEIKKKPNEIINVLKSSNFTEKV